MVPIAALPEVTTPKNKHYPFQVAISPPVPSTSPWQTIRGEHVDLVTHYLRPVGYARVGTFFRDCQVLGLPSNRDDNLASHLPFVAVVYYPRHTTKLGQAGRLSTGYGVDHRTQDYEQRPTSQGTHWPIVPPSRPRHLATVPCDGSSPIILWSSCPENWGWGVKDFRMGWYGFSGDGPSRLRCFDICRSGSLRLFWKENRGHGGYDYRVGVLECPRYPLCRNRGLNLRPF